MPNARFLMSMVALGLLGSVMVGCVPYQKYKDLQSELDRAKQVNADMIKKYNQLLLKGGPAANESLLAEIAQLKQQLAEGPRFERADAGQFELEKGGIRMGAALLFDEGSATLKSSAFASLDGFVDMLASKYADEVLIIEGHTDIQPLQRTRAMWEDNMNLAFNRARAVFKYFNKAGIPESRMIVHAYSFNKPTDKLDIHSLEAKRKNRRVVVRRTGQTAMIDAPRRSRAVARDER